MMASVAAINNLSEHAHNPRGNLWFNDESTYGHKLLMKMGWNKGKGLGKNENGIKENVKVKFRNTNSGLGFKDDAFANIMKTEYESILKNLASEYSCSSNTNLSKTSDAKPVQKTKVIKSKLRYPKLFFGKDVGKYSEKDMKSIFICSTPLKSTEEKIENPVVSDKKSSESELPQASDTFSSSLSISDYFAKKMAEKKNHTLDKNASYTVIHQETAFNVEKPNQASSEIESAEINDLDSSNKKSSKKRKKKHDISIKDIEVNSGDIEPCISDNGKKDTIENLCDNSNISAVENISSQNSSRKSKKRKLSQMLENESVESSENAFPCELQSLLPIKKKKLKEHTVTVENPSDDRKSFQIFGKELGESSENAFPCEIESLSPVKKKKKKKKPKKYSVTIQLPLGNIIHVDNRTPVEVPKEPNNHNLLEPVEDAPTNGTSCSKKKEKSKKKLREKLKSCLKSKCGSYSFKNVSFNETVSYRIIDSELESVLPLVSCESLDENTALDELKTSDQNNSEDGFCSEEKTAACGQDLNSGSITKEEDKVSEEESGEKSTLADLPSSKSSHYNAWIESQRQALKMDLYKKLIKSLKHHDILKTTNLLSIKGYGNWGYE